MTLCLDQLKSFEIPVDDLKVASNHPSSAGSTKGKGKNPKKLAAELKAKEERAEKNRQKELDKIQQAAQVRDEAVKKAQERKKVSSSQSLDQ